MRHLVPSEAPLEGEERKISDLRYRNKETSQGLKFYLDVKDIVVEFAEQSADMLHGWSSDIVEGMNRFFTKFLPKDRTYAMTIENQVRIHLAICIDSAGYQETYSRLAEATGLRLGSINENLNRLLNDEKQYRPKYRKRSYVKINCRWKCFGKLRENTNKLVRENRKNLRYVPDIAGPFKEDRGTGDDGKSTTAVSRAAEGLDTYDMVLTYVFFA
jgi:spore cortex formation protein SpoVR/YcgB (stage V sporulation)